MPRDKKKQAQAGTLDQLGGTNIAPTLSGYDKWKSSYTKPITWKLEKILQEAGITDEAVKQQFIEALTSPEAHAYGQKVGRGIATDLSKNVSQDPKNRHTQSDIYQRIASGDVQGLQKLIGMAASGQQVPSAGTTKLPSNVPAPIESLIDTGVDTAKALTGMGGGGIKALLDQIGKIPGITADMLGGIGNLLSGAFGGGQGGGGGGQGGGGQGGGPSDEYALFRPQQEKVMDQLMNMGLKELQGNQYNFAPIRQEAYRQFEQQGLPSLAQRFTNLGGRRGSGGFNRYATQARGDLESQLAALESQYQQGRYGQLQNLTSLGLGRRFEPKIIEKQPTGMQQLTQGLLQGAVPPLAKYAGEKLIDYGLSFVPGGAIAKDVAKATLT